MKSSGSKLWQFPNYPPFTKQSFEASPPGDTFRRMEAESRIACITCKADRSSWTSERAASIFTRSQNQYFQIDCRTLGNVKKTSVTENYAEGIWRSLERDVFPVIGEICITDIETHTLLKAIQQVQASALMRWWYTPKIPGLLALFIALISVRPLRKLKRRIYQLYENKCFYEKDDGVQDNVYPFTPRHYYQFWIAW